ncbi:hypothetical protein PROFUN_03099 [Planoprotostelium fungivorum]|uniref:Uncharacterized protein n=1 Tax=Planoprotostelium fungivorum TaxID=1890364 RepID=A0A2P6NQ82_9EUKA|nr:hypothetical protein PROFUN_03099 [Planoprotostelium fungivorum]
MVNSLGCEDLKAYSEDLLGVGEISDHRRSLIVSSQPSSTTSAPFQSQAAATLPIQLVYFHRKSSRWHKVRIKRNLPSGCHDNYREDDSMGEGDLT